MDGKETVLEVMAKAGKPMSAGQIAEAPGLDRQVVDKAMSELKKEKKLSRQKDAIGKLQIKK